MTTACCVPERLVVEAADRREAVLAVVSAATRSLCVSIYRCSDRAVLTALVEASARGVRVEVLMTRKVRKEKYYLRGLREYLSSHGIRVVRSPRHARYHAKYVIADGRIGLISSANFTDRCFSRTSDFMLVSSDPELVGDLSSLFESDCGPTDEPLAPSRRLIVGPELGRPAMTSFVRSARRSIRIADRKLDDPLFRALLAERQTAGLDVRVLDRRKLGSQTSHGKLCIVDGRTAIVGSIALSTKALARGRELSVRVDDPALVAQLTATFDTALVHAAMPFKAGSRAA
jgi:phosphatidylserine/phosphatidylglycerophosphate/cardiolipin synthase-like enzyme